MATSAGILDTQPLVARAIGAAVAGGRVGHAYLLAGPAGIGKLESALAIGRLVSCHAPIIQDGHAEPCGACASCLLAYQPDRHHDLLLVDPAVREVRSPLEGSGSGREVKFIDRLREAMSLLALEPIVARRKTLILPRIDALQPVQLSVLLKTIEEPPASGLLILTASNASAVLPTILSRCQVLELRPIGTAETLALLGRDDADARAVALLSGGRPPIARRLLAHERLSELLEGLRGLSRLAISRAPLESLRAADSCRSLCVLWSEATAEPIEGDDPSEEEKVRRSLDAVLFPLEALLRDRLAAACRAGVAPLCPPGLDPGGGAGSGDALGRLRAIARTKRAVQQNASTRLALEALFLALGAS